MRITAISDTHGQHRKLEPAEADVLIHAGDFTGRGTGWETEEFASWIGSLDHPHKIVIAGNHDEYAEEDEQHTRFYFEERGVSYLQDETIWIDGIPIWGSPWTPLFYDWSFMMDEHQLEQVYDLIPEDTGILITHGPPQGVLDLTLGGVNAGSHALANRLNRLPDLRLHVFGHIHEGAGQGLRRGARMVNASVVDAGYHRISTSGTVVEL